MAETKVKSTELAPNKYTDANGWTVYDYGTWKEYEYFLTGNPPSIAAGSGYSPVEPSLPVGVTFDSVFIQVSGANTYREIYFAVDSNTTLSVQFVNTFGSALDPTWYWVSWHLKDK